MKVTRKGPVAALAPDHPDRETAQSVLMESLGSGDYDFVDGLIAQVGLICRVDQGTAEYERQLNFILSAIRSLKPQDEIETMLGAQAAAVHMASMTFARRLALVETVPQQDSALRALNSLARTYARQIEALRRFRSGGEHRVIVQQVNVGDGGQAIVGNVPL
jgi:hypothetical protein